MNNKTTMPINSNTTFGDVYRGMNLEGIMKLLDEMEFDFAAMEEYFYEDNAFYPPWDVWDADNWVSLLEAVGQIREFVEWTNKDSLKEVE